MQDPIFVFWFKLVDFVVQVCYICMILFLLICQEPREVYKNFQMCIFILVILSIYALYIWIELLHLPENLLYYIVTGFIYNNSLFYLKILIDYRKRNWGRGERGERETLLCCLLHAPLPEIKPST